MAPRAGLDEAVVMRAAAELVDEEGFEGLSLSRLAERLGVRSPSLYKHVAGLEAVQRGVALLALRAIARRMAEAAVGKAGPDAMMAIAEAYRAYAKEHPGLYAATLRAPEPGDREWDEASDQLLGIIIRVLEPFALGEEGTLHAIRGLRSLVHGFASLESSGGFGMPLDIDESFRRLMTSFLAGLRAERT
ncbi:WHG domain-containing protein [bacterium]|nr:WHG domain-containing protein [bacterium]